MATDGGINLPALPPDTNFNWVFLVELIVCGIITIFFLFYFNRVFAKVLSVAARLYLRSIGNPHYIDIESLQISVLAGRIFFGKITYHGPNETFIVVGGQVTWRYWLRRVRHVPERSNQSGTEDIADGVKGASGTLPCRVLVELKGLEWFIYNRSPQYDWIMTEMENAVGNGGRGGPPATPSGGEEFLRDSHMGGIQSPKSGSTTVAPRPSSLGTNGTQALETFESRVARSPYLRMLPIRVDCNRGAVVVGNSNTPSILVAQFEKAQGTIDARKSRSIDQYKQVYDISFTHPKIQLKSNANFKEGLLSRGLREQGSATAVCNINTSTPSRTRRQKVLDLLPLFGPSVDSFTPSHTETNASHERQSGNGQWMGLSRYLDEPAQGGWKFEPEEYAIESEVIDCESATMSLYWDVVGTVPSSDPAPQEGGKQLNGDIYQAPEYGLDLLIKGGTIQYGPWADRQRIVLQNMFVPKLYKPTTPAQPLSPGAIRVYTEFKVFVEFPTSTILRVPIRENSKDWKYRRRLEDGEIRPPGWLEIKVGSESTANYNMGFVASSNGWTHTLELELRKAEVRSSVNHGLLWEAEKQTLQCDLSGPLQWNADTKWVFSNVSSDMRVFLLREHVTLLTDLVSDWTSGAGPEYWTFVPMIYELNLKLENSEFFFNVNDENIINNPSSFDDNTFLVLRNLGGKNGHLQGLVSMDFREYRSQSSAVEFTVATVSEVDYGGTLELGVRAPLWNTWNCSLQRQYSLGTVQQVKLQGSYEFFAETSPELLDTLSLDIDGEGVELALHGFLIRYFLLVKENYFGEYIHFTTLDEWQSQQDASTSRPDSSLTPPPAKSNDLDVVLGVRARNIAILLPKHIYDSKEHLRFNSPSLDLDMRFTNYYMDLQVDVAPLSAYTNLSTTMVPEVFINGITIFGHRLFGLPPSEPTYVCNWDLGVGDVSGECSLDFLQTAIFALRNSAFSFQDVENALPVSSMAVIHDVTFVRLSIGSVRLWLHLHDSNVFRLTVDEVLFVLNDLADETHSERILLKLPGLSVACMVLDQRDVWSTKVYLDTDVKVAMLNRKKDARTARKHQQKHVRQSDHRTGRAAFLLRPDDFDSTGSSIVGDKEPASLPLPDLPQPIYSRNGLACNSNRLPDSDSSSGTTKSSDRKSCRSFLAGSQKAPSTRMATASRAASSHAPSFHSAVESLSDVRDAVFTRQRPGLPRSVSSTATLSGSKYSGRASPSSYRLSQPELTSRKLNVTLASPFGKPKFALHNIEPDLSHVPQLDQLAETRSKTTGGDVDMFIDEDSSRDSIIIELLPGVRGYCSPAGVVEIANLLENTQTQTPEEILDTIQTEVVSKLAKIVKKIGPHSKIVEVCLRIPEFKFCFEGPSIPFELDHRTDFKGEAYAFCLQFRNLVLSGRSKEIFHTGDSQQSRPEKVASVHVLLDHLGLQLEDRSLLLFSMPRVRKPAVDVGLEDILFWASIAETSTASLWIKQVHVAVEGSQTLFLYDTGMQVASLMNNISGMFTMLADIERRRLQKFVIAIATAGEELHIIHDPASLTRPSYVLRTAKKHVRLNDSWKINARLRHVWQSLPDQIKDELSARCVENTNPPPRGAKDTFIGIFQRWRGWELGNITNCIIIKQIFGDFDTKSEASFSLPLNTAIVIDSIRVAVDPGPTQHEFLIDQLHGSVRLGNTDFIGSAASSVTAANTIVQVHTRSINLGVRWEVLDIAETIFSGLSKRQEQSPVLAPSKTPVSTEKRRSGGFHIVFTTEHGSLSLDTVNLKVLTMVKNINASLVMSGKDVTMQEENFSEVGNILLRADYGTLEICSGNKVLSKGLVRTPSVYGYFDDHWFAETNFQIWKVTATSENISFDVQEQVLGLMEVIDFVVNDEVAHIYRLMCILENAHSSRPSMELPVMLNRKVHMIYCTTSVDQFSVGAALLPSLAYMVRGGGARFSARPNSKDSNEMIVDFDLLHHEHEVRTTVQLSETRSISLLQLPAINVSLSDRNTEEERLIEAAVSVQTIALDASAIQSLLNAIKKPELLKVIENSRSELRAIDTKLEEIFGHQKEPTPPVRPKKPLVCRSHVGIAGLKIETLAPTANLEVNLGFIQVHASNKPTLQHQLLASPEIRLEFGRVTLELTKTNENGIRDSCGYLELHASLHTSSKLTDKGVVRAFDISSHSLKINLFDETASAVVDVAGHLQDRLRDLDLSREVKYLKKLRNAKPLMQSSPNPSPETELNNLFSAPISLEMTGIQVSWISCSELPLATDHPTQDLVLSFKRIYFSTARRKSNEAQLVIEEFLLQMVDAHAEGVITRSDNSALMPEVIFNVAYCISASERSLAFQAKGTALDLRLTSSCVFAASSIEKSISRATQKFRDASSSWKLTPTESGTDRASMFTTKRLSSVLVDADFAGAVVHFAGGMAGGGTSGARRGRYGQFAQGEANNGTTSLKSPGLAFKLEYTDPVDEDPSLSAEVKISASTNILYPSVVPLILEMSDNVKEVMKQPSDTNDVAQMMGQSVKDTASDANNTASANPAAILGRCRLNIGVRICKQEFTLSCQPIARVAASAGYEQIYATITTCDESEDRFYSISTTVNGLRTSLQHVYSRESTGNLEVQTFTLSLVGGRRSGGAEGISCMTKFSPIKAQVNVKQFQDFLLFREIWYPSELRGTPSTPTGPPEEPTPMLVQRYHKVSTTKAFPWSTSVIVSKIGLEFDLGQSLGKSSLCMSNLWITSKKTSDWEQTMCIGFDAIRVSSTGRLNGYVDLKGLNVRTSINWGSAKDSLVAAQTPLIEAAIGFKQLETKATFDYQAFLVANITSLNFLMYNLQVKQGGVRGGDRLVGVLDGGEVQLFCTALSAAQGLAVYQAFQRLAQEKMASFELSLKEVETFLNRGSQSRISSAPALQVKPPEERSQSSISGVWSLHTDVVINLKEVNLGAFPSTFYDTQVFKIEIVDATARFAVESQEKERIHSRLEMTLGQLRIALSPVKKASVDASPADVSVEKVIAAVNGSKGGIILKVPQVTAFMHTWHTLGSTAIDYIFKSAFEGQVDVGWNFSRVSFIKGMYHNHTKALARRQGKAHTSSHISMYTDGSPPNSATTSERGEHAPVGSEASTLAESESSKATDKSEKGKIETVIDVPQSKYEYHPLEPPIIETPRLRDMGEATPPLEWIGLNRDRLPNLTHQIVIVSLLEVAREVEDAYSKILGST